MQFARDRLKCRVAAAAAELHTFRKTRVTLRAHHHHQRRRMSAVFAVETPTTRRRQLITRRSDLELGFDDLFCDVAANLDHAFVIGFT